MATKLNSKEASAKNGFIEDVDGSHIELSLHNGKDGEPRTFKHLFEREHINAINTAIACERPLLLTGDPGVGKSQLARAAANVLGRKFVRHTVDAKTESRDLLWHFDAVARLADSQLAQPLGWNEADCKEKLAVENYLRPGPLWWGFDWVSAEQQNTALPEQVEKSERICHSNGVVVLIDEIDKAEIDVPNGLLEALGDGRFHPDGRAEPVSVDKIAPLIVITSNRERGLPDAFIRRCVVMKIKLPSDEDDLKALMVARGKAHCHQLSDGVIEEAADLFIKDRNWAKEKKLGYLPGQAEYLDLLRAIENLGAGEKNYRDLLKMVSPYVLRKGDKL